jgi:hypothetical protein
VRQQSLDAATREFDAGAASPAGAVYPHGMIFSSVAPLQSVKDRIVRKKVPTEGWVGTAPKICPTRAI